MLYDIRAVSHQTCFAVRIQHLELVSCAFAINMVLKSIGFNPEGGAGKCFFYVLRWDVGRRWRRWRHHNRSRLCYNAALRNGGSALLFVGVRAPADLPCRPVSAPGPPRRSRWEGNATACRTAGVGCVLAVPGMFHAGFAPVAAIVQPRRGVVKCQSPLHLSPTAVTGCCVSRWAIRPVHDLGQAPARGLAPRGA